MSSETHPPDITRTTGEFLGPESPPGTDRRAFLGS